MYALVMFPQVSDALERAIDELEIPVDREALVSSCRLLDQLTAKVVQAVGDYDAAEMWHVDGATSMTAWLRAHTDRVAQDASWMTRTASRLRQLPVTASAYRGGSLSTGQMKAIVRNISDKTIERFAQQEADLVPHLQRLTLSGVSRAMQHWRNRAEADLDDEPGNDDEQSLHVSRTLDGRREVTGSLNAETGAVVEAALRLANRPDTNDEPDRSPARQRADALDTVARFFLDHQTVNLGRRHRPHLNVFVNYDDITNNDDDQSPSRLADIDATRTRRDRASGWLADGTAVDAATIRRLLCDAGIHRLVTSGSSAILDYGRTTRTISAAVFAALVARDRHCRFPGCDRPPAWCEAHHLVPWEHGGVTDLQNLALLCSRHHHLLHSPGWNAKTRTDGTIEITRPTGEPLTSRPPQTLYDIYDTLRKPVS
jgi:uncharacterized protein DUF222/HNH endonuclease